MTPFIRLSDTPVLCRFETINISKPSPWMQGFGMPNSYGLGMPCPYCPSSPEYILSAMLPMKHATAILTALAALPVFAHNDIVTSSVVTVGPSGVECRMKVAMTDVLRADGASPEEIAGASEERILAAVGRIVDHARSRLVVRDDAGDHPMTLTDHERVQGPDPDTEYWIWNTDRLLLRWSYAGELGKDAVLRSLLFEELGLGHRNALLLKRGAEEGEWLLYPRETLPLGNENLAAAAEASRNRAEPVPEAPSGLGEGMTAPFRRVSLVLFLAALFLVPAGRVPSSKFQVPSSPTPTWNVEPGTWNPFVALAAFALAAAAGRLGWVSAPGRFLGTAAFLTAWYTAFENLFAGGNRGRWILALLFGPVHGLAFAGGIPAAASPLFYGGAAFALPAAGAGLSLITARLGRGPLRAISALILILAAAGLAGRFLPVPFLAGWN